VPQRDATTRAVITLQPSDGDRAAAAPSLRSCRSDQGHGSSAIAPSVATVQLAAQRRVGRIAV